MDFSDSGHYSDFDDEKKGGRRGCLGWLTVFLVALVGVVALVVGGIALFLATDLGRLWALNKINRAIAPAHLAVEQWDVGLFGAAKLEGVAYLSPEQGLKVDARQIVFTKGVLAFIPIAKLALGDVTVDSPVISFDPAAVQKKRPLKGVETKAEKKESFFIPVVDVSGSLFVKNGSIIVNNSGVDIFKSDALDGRLLVNSIWKPFGFEIKGHAGAGVVGLTGDLQSISSLGKGADSDYTDKLVLQLERVDLAEFAPVLVMLGSPVLPHSGIAEGALTLERSGRGGLLKAEGGILIEKMRVVTGDKKYSPAGDIALLVDAEIKDKLCAFRKFDFSSPWGRINLKGSVQQVDEVRWISGDVAADISIDLAAVFRDFSHTLAINEDLLVSKGRLNGYLKMKTESNGVHVDTSLKVVDLAMLYKKRPVSIDRDPSLTLKMYLPDNALPEIEELHLRGSFVDVYGKGNILQGALKGYVDFSQFSKDFKGLLKTDAILGGAAHFNLSTSPSGDNVAFDLITKLSKLNVTYPEIGVSSVQEGSLTCRGSVVGAATAKKAADLTLNDIDYDLRLNKSRVHGSVVRFVPAQRGKTLPVLRGLTVSAEMNIVDLVKACGALMKREAYIDAVACRGNLLANMAVESANSVAKMRFNGVGRDVTFKVAGQEINEPDIRFGGAATFDEEHVTLALDAVDLTSGVVDLKIPSWFIQFPGNGLDLKFNGDADALFDVGFVHSLLAKEKSAYDQVHGKLKLGLKTSGTDSGANVDFNGTLTDLYLLVDQQIMFYEKRAELHTTLAFNKGGDNVVVKTFNYYSAILDVTATGDIRDLWKNRIADLSGDMDVKFDSLDRMLRVRGIDEWKLNGHKRTPFKLKGPLTAEFPQKASFSGGAYLASLTGLGLNAGGAGISLEMNKGRVQCDWSPVLNSGRLRFTPIFDFSPHGTTVLMPDGVQLLEKVKITQEMVDKLFVHANPVFAGSRIHQGVVSLKINSFSSGPKPGHSDLMVDAQVELEDFKMTLSPAMQDMLKLINVKSSIYQVESLPMHVMIRKERVHLDSLTMTFSKQPVIFSGSVGFDSTIDYLIEIPLGDMISQKTGLNLPKDLTVKVKMTGTVDNPRIDTSALEKAFGGFIKSTLGDDAFKGVVDFLEKLKKELK